MCGIAGIFHFDHPRPVRKEILSRMLVRIQHRGPDESGIYLGRNIGLGHVRLSILDLKTGSQPIPDKGKRFWIVFNGEIFNYLELREELIKRGHRFRTASDTEVLLHLYMKYGSGCLEKLNGQFAFAIWDKKKQELFLARDRVGIRPLYYTVKNTTFIFASEIKSILEYPEISCGFDPLALSQIFTFWTTLSPTTSFKNIFELPPGHSMTVSREGIRLHSYWRFTFPEKGVERKTTLEDALSELDEIYRDAVRIRLRADVPVGAYLSGGIDSSITTAYIRDIFPDMLRTFSIGFTEKEFDESYYQNLAVKFFRTSHSSIVSTSAKIASTFPEVVWHTETPLLRTAPVPMMLLSGNVRKNHYKVVVTGEGADEMFAGYNIFKEMIIRRFWARQPNSRMRPLLLTRLYPYLPHLKENPQYLKFFFGYKLLETESPYYSHMIRWNNTSRIKGYFSEEMKRSTADYDPLEDLTKMLPDEFHSWTPLSKAQWLETSLFMSGYLLSSQGDRMAMANSVEGRYPFLDHRVMEFAASIPQDFKLKGLTEKYILKKMMKGKLPPEILKRPKQAYRAPINSTFVQNEPDYLKNLLSTGSIRETGIFSPGMVDNLLQKMRMQKQVSETENMALTAIISTQLLYEQFVKNKQEQPQGKPAGLHEVIDIS